MEKNISYNLEYIRKINKLSRKQLEDISGFKERTIGAYERGENPPTKEYIEFISLYFGFTEEFITGERTFYVDKIYDIVSSNLEDFGLSGEDDIDIDDILRDEKNHFYFTDIFVALHRDIRVLKMYQSIFNYDDNKMSELLEIPLNEYLQNIKDNEKFLSFDNILKVSLKLNIKYDSFSSMFDHIIMLRLKNSPKYKEIKEQCDKIKDKQIYTNPLYITPKYYASIIKQRNNPEIVTPNTLNAEINPKYKEILELLPFANDTFLTNLKNKLLQLKNNQNLDDL